MKQSFIFAFSFLLFIAIGFSETTSQTQVGGWNRWGQLGQGQAGIGFFPTPLAIPDVNDTMGVAGGWSNTYFIKTDGSVLASG